MWHLHCSRLLFITFFLLFCYSHTFAQTITQTTSTTAPTTEAPQAIPAAQATPTAATPVASDVPATPASVTPTPSPPSQPPQSSQSTPEPPATNAAPPVNPPAQERPPLRRTSAVPIPSNVGTPSSAATPAASTANAATPSTTDSIPGSQPSSTTPSQPITSSSTPSSSTPSSTEQQHSEHVDPSATPTTYPTHRVRQSSGYGRTSEVVRESIVLPLPASSLVDSSDIHATSLKYSLPSCDRTLSRRVRLFLQELFYKDLTTEQMNKLPYTCPFHPELDIYRYSETYKQYKSKRWRCTICNKYFKNEYFMDQHLDTEHVTELRTDNEKYKVAGVTPICLADQCDLLSCSKLFCFLAVMFFSCFETLFVL